MLILGTGNQIFLKTAWRNIYFYSNNCTAVEVFRFSFVRLFIFKVGITPLTYWSALICCGSVVSCYTNSVLQNLFLKEIINSTKGFILWIILGDFALSTISFYWFMFCLVLHVVSPWCWTIVFYCSMLFFCCCRIATVINEFSHLFIYFIVNI